VSRDRLPPSSAADRLDPLATLARAAAVSTAAEADRAGWDALGAAFAHEARRRRWRRGLAGAGLAVALAMAGGAMWRGTHRARLSYVVDGAVPDPDGYIPRVQAARAAIRFSDGTEVALARGSRARVVATGADGAQLRLEDGRAHLEVVHRPHARWSVEAGPFVVLVTGTTFDVGWSGADGVLRVRLLAGVVTVRGPLTRGGVTLQPGQELEAHPDDGVLRIVPVPSAANGATPSEAKVPAPPAVPPPAPPLVLPPSAPPAAAPPVVAPPPVSPVSAAPPASPAAVAPRATAHAKRPVLAGGRAEPREGQALGADWGRRIANGDFDTIVREVEEHGSVRCLRELPSDRLAALGDAARYAGQAELARRALIAQRERFAGTRAAEEAAFLLGRLAEDSHEPRATALGWYDLYLDEAPRGAYAAEALGRKLLLIDAEAAAPPETVRGIARDYLERYPTGPYASRARAILEGGR
jgi:hypothetical protein